MARNAEDIFQQMGIEGGAEAVTHAAATFIRLHPLYSAPPTSKDLSEHELKVLEEGGFPTVPDTVSLGDNIAIVAGEVGVMIASALSQSQAAQLLGVDQSRIRQRIGQGTLYTITGENNVKVLPRFQFTDEGVLPGLEKVLPVINNEAHPIAVQRFFLTVSSDLYSEELQANLSPRDWLISGHNPDAVVRMAADL
ncbi:MAG: hypothetical protein PVJ72_10585 [Gammaproteobacteria bacterium]|jgi:hypothetical protein